MGTRLIARGLRLAATTPASGTCPIPTSVLAIHRRDVAAGSEAVADQHLRRQSRLARSVRPGRRDRSRRSTGAAVALARRAAGPGRFVARAIGPTAADGPTPLASRPESWPTPGVDALIFETHRLDQAEAALGSSTRGAPVGLPLLVSLLAWPDPPARAVAPAGRLGGRRASGRTARPGWRPALALAERLRRATALPLDRQARRRAARASPPTSPAAFARGRPRAPGAGARSWSAAAAGPPRRMWPPSAIRLV